MSKTNGYNIKIEKIFDGTVFKYNKKDKRVYKERFEYFSLFFDTSRLECKDVYQFIFREEHRRYTDAFIKALHLTSYEKDNLFTRFENQKTLDLFQEIFNNNQEQRKFYRDSVKAILWLSFLGPDSNNQKTITGDLEYWKDDKNKGFFRGQADSSWQLKPSILRDFKYNDTKLDGCYIDNERLFSIYNNVELIDKYNRHIGKNKILSGDDIDYNFLSFMQHSISYSPLIDFTSDIDVACKFALTKNNPNTFLFGSSAVFVLTFENSGNKNNSIKDFNIKFLNKRIKPGTIMNIEKTSGEKYELDFTTIDSIKRLLKPKFCIFDNQTNDRMIYQKGKFILFYDYVSVQGNVYYFLNKHMAIFKREIYVKEKKDILGKIDSNMNNSYLMDPYKIFND